MPRQGVLGGRRDRNTKCRALETGGWIIQPKTHLVYDLVGGFGNEGLEGRIDYTLHGTSRLLLRPL